MKTAAITLTLVTMAASAGCVMDDLGDEDDQEDSVTMAISNDPTYEPPSGSQTHLPIGYFDSLDNWFVARGWACDQDTPDQPVKVAFYASGVRLPVTAYANQPSEGAVNTQCGGSSHRFEIDLRDYINADDVISARGIDNHVNPLMNELWSSPRVAVRPDLRFESGNYEVDSSLTANLTYTVCNDGSATMRSHTDRIEVFITERTRGEFLGFPYKQCFERYKTTLELPSSPLEPGCHTYPTIKFNTFQYGEPNWRIVVDANGDIAESSESNNVGTSGNVCD